MSVTLTFRSLVFAYDESVKIKLKLNNYETDKEHQAPDQRSDSH